MRGGHFWASWCTADSEGADCRHRHRWRRSFPPGYWTAGRLSAQCWSQNPRVSLTPETTRFVMFSSARDRKDGHRGELTTNARQDSVWSAEQLEAARAVAPSTPIDWASIRQNKQKYEELKWKGQSCLVCARMYREDWPTLDIQWILFDYCLLTIATVNLLMLCGVDKMFVFVIHDRPAALEKGLLHWGWERSHADAWGRLPMEVTSSSVAAILLTFHISYIE